MTSHTSSNHCNDRIYCIEAFKKQVEKLRKNNSYKDIDEVLFQFLNNKSIDQVRTGTLLNKSLSHPYIKHDISGRGGYRLYYLAVIINECLYLAYIHPKTGTHGSQNTTHEARAAFYKLVAEAIETGALYQVKLASERLTFCLTLPK